jgi:hypothetical protein
MSIEDISTREEIEKNHCSRMEAIREIALTHDIDFLRVLEIYSRFNSRVYAESCRKKEGLKLYNPRLECKTYDLTKRYFEIYKE